MGSRRQFLTTAALGLGAGYVRSETPGKPDLRVAVIGHTGRGDYGHELDLMWSKVPGTEVVAVADPVEEGRKRAAERLSARGYEDYRTMLVETRPDIVAIAPRHVDQHHDMTLAAADSGARGIYLEKPFARTLAEADAMIAACAKSGTRLAVAHRMHYHPVLAVAARLLADEALGELVEVRGRGKEDHRGGPLDLWVLGSHVFNLVHHLFGLPLACSATVFKEGRPLRPGDLGDGPEGTGPLGGDSVQARFDLKNGIPFYFSSIRDRGTPEAGFGFRILGTSGSLDFRIDREPLVHFQEGSPFLPVENPAPWQPVTSAGIGRPEPIADLGRKVGDHSLAALDLIDAIENRRAPLCDGDEGRATLEFIHGVFASHKNEGARTALPLENREHPFAGWK